MTCFTDVLVALLVYGYFRSWRSVWLVEVAPSIPPARVVRW